MKKPLKYGFYWYIDFRKLLKSCFEKVDVFSGQHFSLDCRINMTFQPLLAKLFLKFEYSYHRTYIGG